MIRVSEPEPEDVDEWFEAPDPTEHPGAFVAHAADEYGKTELSELAADVRMDVTEHAQDREMGPGAAIAALLLATQNIYETEAFR